MTALSLSIGWGIRGNFGHEYGAMIPGALAAMAVVLMSGREDWRRRVAYFGFFGALGWSFGGSLSYGQVIGYTHSGHLLSVWYGFASLFLIGFLWAAMGGAGTALPAFLSRERLTEFFTPLTAVFAAWWLQQTVVGLLATHSAEFRHEDPLYWYDTDWLEVLVAMVAVLLLAGWRRRLDRASALMLWMAAGWWAGFLILVVGLGLRMTPPRGDNWAGCLGATVAMLAYFQRQHLVGVTLASLMTGFVGGFGFATATMLKLVGVTTGWETNWHSILEQTYGFLNGLGVAAAMGSLLLRAPRLVDTGGVPNLGAGSLPENVGGEAAGPLVRRWTEVYAAAFVALMIPYLNLRKNPEEWVKAGAMSAQLYGLPPLGWFNVGFAFLAGAVIVLLIRHLHRPLPLLPVAWLGRGQWLYLLFLWFMVAGNWERALVSFAPQRLVTEGIIHLNAVLCTLLLLLTAPAQPAAPPTHPAASYTPEVRRLALAGIVAALLSVTLDWAIVRAIYGDRFAGHAGLNIRFGPNATAIEKPKLGQPHP